MDKFCVVGGRPIAGVTEVQSAKNAVLPMLGAVLLCESSVIIERCPRILDVENMCRILEHLGCVRKWEGDSLTVDTTSAYRCEMPPKLSKELRSSIFMLGSVLARFGKAVFSYPGGCEIGNRPIDLHLKGLRELNVKVFEERGYIICDGGNMRGASVHLDYPSVGATENLMMAATAAKGTTVIQNAAREPEITDLADSLNIMGASVSGAGTSVITVEGRRKLKGAVFTPSTDRIAAGTYLAAAAITNGDVTVKGARPEQMQSVIAKFKEAGCEITENGDGVRLKGPKRPREINLLETQPYPGFPTDMQAVFLALCTIASGTSIIVENVFENRFKTAGELMCMGASVTVKDRMAIIRGVEKLTGAQVYARDLRGGAALLLAGLAADGMTVVRNASCVDRGYESIEKVLAELGAGVCRTEDDWRDASASGQDSR